MCSGTPTMLCIFTAVINGYVNFAVTHLNHCKEKLAQVKLLPEICAPPPITLKHYSPPRPPLSTIGPTWINQRRGHRDTNPVSRRWNVSQGLANSTTFCSMSEFPAATPEFIRHKISPLKVASPPPPRAHRLTRHQELDPTSRFPTETGWCGKL